MVTQHPPSMPHRHRMHVFNAWEDHASSGERAAILAPTTGGFTFGFYSSLTGPDGGRELIVAAQAPNDCKIPDLCDDCVIQLQWRLRHSAINHWVNVWELVETSSIVGLRFVVV